MRLVFAAAGLVVGYILGKANAGGEGKPSRGVLKSVVRAGLLATRAIESTVAEVREELSDAVAEAKAEVAASSDPGAKV